MTWAFRRQLIYMAGVAIFFGLLGFWVGYPYFNQPPTCNDRKQNGDERGVDCGGSCQLMCIFEVDQLSVLWSRSFKVVPGRYNAVAYVENKNENTVVQKIKYRFRFADANNVYIGKREGETYIPPASKFAIFEPAIDMGNSVPVYTTFEFTEVPVWVKAPREKTDEINVLVYDVSLDDESNSPGLSAKVKNDSYFIIPDLSLVVILYDIEGNAINVSRTFLDTLKSGESAQVNFTWLEPFKSKVVTREIIPLYNIFSTKLK
jgi:hypothetical protein